MSVVTELIITYSIGEEYDLRLKEINSYFPQIVKKNFGLVRIDDCQPSKYNGSKSFTSVLAFGAFNAFDLKKFALYVQENVTFDCPEFVQIIYKLDDQDIFKIKSLLENWDEL